jgi:hypothetical protein
MASSLHDHTYGITSDPLTQFACVLFGTHSRRGPYRCPTHSLKERPAFCALQGKERCRTELGRPSLGPLGCDTTATPCRHLQHSSREEALPPARGQLCMATDIMIKISRCSVTHGGESLLLTLLQRPEKSPGRTLSTERRPCH